MILSPYDYQSTSLEAADFDFQADKAFYRDKLRFEMDRLKYKGTIPLGTQPDKLKQ